MKFILVRATLIFSLSFIAISALAADNAKPENEAPEAGQRRKPPQAAKDACVDKQEGEMVSFITPRGNSMEASCTLRRNVLIAVPTNPPKGHKQGMQHKQNSPN